MKRNIMEIGMTAIRRICVHLHLHLDKKWVWGFWHFRKWPGTWTHRTNLRGTGASIMTYIQDATCGKAMPDF